MVRVRAIAAALVLVGASVPAVAALSPVSASRVPFGGIARDVAGRALADVEIILLDERQGSRPVATVLTDSAGRFLVPSIRPGFYRIAAIKSGYLASIGSVNTVLRSTFDLVLRPAPKPGEVGADRVRADDAWVLRAPRRSVLRETRSSTLIETASSRPPGRREGESIAGRLEHLVAVAGWSGAGDGATSNVQGGTTTLGLGGAVGNRGSLRFEGSRDRFATPADRGTATPSVDRESTALAVDFDYPTGRGAQLAMKAYYNRRNLESGLEGALGTDRAVERSDAWGYDAKWTRQVDSQATVAVRVGFVDSSLEVPEREAAGAVVTSRGLLNRAVGAEGSFESDAGGGHRLAVGVRAEVLDLADPAVRSGFESLLSGIPTAPGWTVRLRAEDAWSVSAPVTIVYGMGVHQVFSDSDATLLTPSVGASWRNDTLRVTASGTYHVVYGSSGPAGSPAAGAYRPPRALGYDAEIEARLPDGTVCRGRYVYSPVQYDRTGAPGPFEEELFATDGNAADRRAGFALERAFGAGTVIFEIYGGRAAGHLAQPGSYVRPILILEERELEYRAGRFGAHIARSGTRVSLEYRRLVETARTVDTDPLVEAFVELHLAQEVLRLRRLGASCRLLLAARTPTGSVAPGTAASLNNRIRAGLSVSF